MPTSSSSDGGPFYGYDPSQVLPMVFAAVVFILLIAHSFLSFIRYKWWHFGLMMAWAASAWIAGFVCRSISTYNLQNLDVYIAQYILVLTGPVLFAAAEYFILGRLLAYVPYFTPLHPGRVVTTFLFLSAAVESLTAAGASIIASDPTPSKRSLGLDLVKAALLLQCVVESSFISLIVLVERRCRKGGLFKKNIRIVCYVLYLTSLMILVRCIFRVVEGFEQSSCPKDKPFCSYVDRHEWFLWVFEVANITIFVLVLAVLHPGKYLPNNAKIYLDPVDGRTERIGPGFSEASQRNFVQSLLDPFDLAGMISGDSAKRLDKFWERSNPVAELDHWRSGAKSAGEEKANLDSDIPA